LASGNTPPEHSDLPAKLDRALALHGAGDFAEALTLYDEAALALPGNHRLWAAVAAVALDLGDLDHARTAIGRALVLAPNDPAFLVNASGIALRRDDKPEAETAACRALTVAPLHPTALNNLARSLSGTNRPAAQDQASRRTGVVQPGDPVALMARVLWASETGEPFAATRAAARGLCVLPGDPTFLSNLGAAWVEQGDNKAALRAYRQSLISAPGFAAAWYNLGNLFEREADIAASIRAHDRAVLLAPHNADYQFNRALMVLLSGDFARGFAALEHRWRSKAQTTAWREPGRALWDGRRLNGETVLVWAEQGLGDTLHFSRYMRLITERGGTPQLEAQPELGPLLRLSPETGTVFARGEDPPPIADYHIPMMSLAQLAGHSPDSVPPPISFQDLPAPWIHSKTPDMLDVGLAWAGNPKHRRDHERSMRLEFLAPLAALANVRLHVIQHGEALEQIETCSFKDRLVIHPITRDFLETAALVRGLDLMITVDTANAHLAGTLGVETWILIAHVPDWRWLMHRSDSIWYPGARLYRQDRSRIWEPVIARVARDLSQFKRGLR